MGEAKRKKQAGYIPKTKNKQSAVKKQIIASHNPMLEVLAMIANKGLRGRMRARRGE